jgi:hypothetical protein
MCDDAAHYGRGAKGHERIHSISIEATEYLPAD